jgi:hypothetical protein
MSMRKSIVVIAVLAGLGWVSVFFGLALNWVAGRFAATLLGLA